MQVVSVLLFKRGPLKPTGDTYKPTVSKHGPKPGPSLEEFHVKESLQWHVSQLVDNHMLRRYWHSLG